MSLGFLNKSLIGGKKTYGKLFAKTNSVSADWKVRSVFSSEEIRYTIIDNLDGSIVKQDVFYNNHYGLI